MPTPAVIPRSPFVSRTAQPPYSHVENSTRTELDRLVLTAPRQEEEEKRKTKRHEGRRSQEAKAIATSKIVVNLPEFTGKDLSKFAENFGRFLRMTG